MRVFKYVFIALLLFLMPSWVAANEACKDVEEQFRQIVEGNYEPSYMTLASGYDPTEGWNPENTLYEGEIYSHLNWLNPNSSDIDKQLSFDSDPTVKVCDEGRLYRVYFPIRLQVRQFESDSSPVRTPSYNPGIKVYWMNNMEKTERVLNYASFGFYHYSNGQLGPHLNSITNLPNTEDGSFSSDYLEFSYFGFEQPDENQWLKWWKVNLRTYLLGLTWEPDQTDRFEKAKLDLSAKTSVFDIGYDWKSEWQLTTSYKYGKSSNELSDITQLLIEGRLKPSYWEDLGLYLRYDYGNDYYNIHYRKKMNRIQLGISFFPAF